MLLDYFEHTKVNLPYWFKVSNYYFWVNRSKPSNKENQNKKVLLKNLWFDIKFALNTCITIYI